MAQAAVALGVPKSTLEKYCQRNGIRFRHGRPSRPSKYRGEVASRLRQCARRGLTTTQAAEELGLTKSAVEYACRYLKVRFRPNRKNLIAAYRAATFRRLAREYPHAFQPQENAYG